MPDEHPQPTVRAEDDRLDGPRWSRDAPGAFPERMAPHWEGSRTFSESGDENADGDVSPETADYVATEGNRRRLTAEERARSFQRPLGEPPRIMAGGAVPEAWDDYGLGRPGRLSPDRKRDRPGVENPQISEEEL